MISTTYKWTKVADLKEYLFHNPDKVYIDGMNMHTNKPFHGYVSTIPYGDTIVVNNKKGRYYFKKNTDGTFIVY